MVNSPERGLLLLRCRDEIRMTLDAYKTLYDSSVTFGVRKQMESEAGMTELEEHVEKLKAQKKDCQNKVIELNNKVEILEKRADDKRKLQEKKNKEELDFMKYQGQHLDAFLKSVVGTGK